MTLRVRGTDTSVGGKRVYQELAEIHCTRCLIIMKLPIYAAVLLSLLLPSGANTRQKTIPPECTKVTRVRGSFPKGPFKTLLTESYKNAPSVKFLIQEDGSVSDVSITRSSGVADIDKKVLESVSQWKYKARPSGCGVIENQGTVLIHWGESH